MNSFSIADTESDPQAHTHRQPFRALKMMASKEKRAATSVRSYSTSIPKGEKVPAIPRPSASVLVISPQNQSSIVIPGYLVSCLETDSLRCKINIDRLPLVVDITSGGSCQATYDKQIVTCERIRASAADTVYIQDLQLSRKQQKAIEAKIWVKSIASPRILDDGVANGLLLQFVLFILSIWSGINVY